MLCGWEGNRVAVTVVVGETFAAVRGALNELLGFLFVGLGLWFLVGHSAAQTARGAGEAELETRPKTRESTATYTRTQTDRHRGMHAETGQNKQRHT